MSESLTLSPAHPQHVPAAAAQPLLQVRDLQVAFGSAGAPTPVVRGVTFEIHPGETLVLLGESGSGKSVTSRAVLRLYGRSVRISGEITLAGRDLTELTERQMRDVRGGEIGMVPQDPSATLDPLRRVGGQLGEVLRRHGITRGRRETRLRAEELLRQVGVPDPARVYRSLPHELSGGLRQRVVIAMGIACSPKLLIADEPTTALDVTVQAQVLELFSTLRDELGMGLLMVTHDVGVAREIADRVAVMYAGSLVEEGPSDDVVRAPLHPYTAGLLNALPRPDVPRGQLVAIPGRPPAAGEIPAVGCAFAARCDFAIDSCRTETPPLLQIGDRATACPVVDAHRALGVALQPGAHQPGGRLVAPEWLVPQQHAPLHDAASAPTPDTAPTGDNE